MNRLRQGDQAVAWLIFQRFARRLTGLARSRLDDRVRAKVGPEDVVQSALNSFFQRHAEGQFELESWDNLWSLLTVITLRKCGHKTEHFLAACRDVRRESKSLPADDDSTASWQAIAREPTPEEAMRLTETVELMFHGLDDLDRQTIELSLQGYKVAEISTRLGRSERSIYRLLERCKRRLEGPGAGDAR
jgi:RNA polymerase sigma-70 factor (ECF subfamily)